VLWFVIWASLLLGWAVAVALSLRWLWRQAKALMAALEELGSALERLDGGGNFAAAKVQPVAINLDPTQLDQVRRDLRNRRARRRQRRQAAHQSTYRQWAVLAGWRDE